MDPHSVPGYVPEPIIIAVRGPSRSGKTAMSERLIERLQRGPVRVGYVKRTHHLLDLPAKASGRIWTHQPAAMLLHAEDRTQLTLPPMSREAGDLIHVLPPALHVVLLETHTPEPYPTIRSEAAEPCPGERVIGEFSLDRLDESAAAAATAIRAELANCAIQPGVIRDTAQHSSRGCEDLVLGTRLALAGAASLSISVPDRQGRLRLAVETDSSAVDAIEAVTGCTVGRGTMTVRGCSRLAATFFDDREGVATRVAARADLRSRVNPAGTNGATARPTPGKAYLALSDRELFTISEAPYVTTRCSAWSPGQRPDDTDGEGADAACSGSDGIDTHVRHASRIDSNDD